jgi:hypothetical protein
MPSPLDRAEQAYHRAVFGGDPSELDSALDDLVGDAPKTLLARGRVLHARFLTDGVASGEELTCFDDALVGFRAEHDRTGEAQALFWQGCYWQVIARDEARAIGPLEAAAKLSAECGDDQTRSYALRHLGIAEHRSGTLARPGGCWKNPPAFAGTLGSGPASLRTLSVSATSPLLKTGPRTRSASPTKPRRWHRPPGPRRSSSKPKPHEQRLRHVLVEQQRIRTGRRPRFPMQ